MECCCFLRKLHDKMADGMTACGKIFGVYDDGPAWGLPRCAVALLAVGLPVGCLTRCGHCH